MFCNVLDGSLQRYMICSLEFVVESAVTKYAIMGILYEDAGCVDVYCTMGVEVDARSRRLSASNRLPECNKHLHILNLNKGFPLLQGNF